MKLLNAKYGDIYFIPTFIPKLISPQKVWYVIVLVDINSSVFLSRFTTLEKIVFFGEFFTTKKEPENPQIQ